MATSTYAEREKGEEKAILHVDVSSPSLRNTMEQSNLIIRFYTNV